jgi:predicted nuclease with TOPRIM domain
MTDQEVHIKRISDKLQQLVKNHGALQKENEKLKTELGKKQDTEQQLKERASLLEQQLGIIKASSGQLDEASKKDLEKQLNHYVKEIDRCIAILSE